MYELMEKGFLLVCCLTLGLAHSPQPALAAPFLAALAISAGNSYRDATGLKIAGILLFALVSLWEPSFLLFAPLMIYDAAFSPAAWFSPLLLPAAVLQFSKIGLPLMALLALFSAAAFLVKARTARLHQLWDSHNQLRDSMTELTLKLKRTNRELIRHQDEQVHTVRLEERNRIAREIHDNVGHLLSSAMLQLGAVLALPQAKELRGLLLPLKDTLASGMDSIRQSVHGLHDDSVDLQEELSALSKAFSFCPVTLDYDVALPPERNIKYAFVAITKEALSNIARHSAATAAFITVREHPALYQLDIRDNGPNAQYSPESTTGIGIANMTNRVSELKGHIHISAGNGFRIFISIPKEAHV